MKIYVYDESMSIEEQKDGAYWERNMLALSFADGWYEDLENNWDGWKRVLCCKGGAMNFHIPDDFDVGNLKKIEPKWDGHSTEEKWNRVMVEKGICDWIRE